MKTLILVDGNAILHRAYHALPHFKTMKGEVVNAVYGFAAMLLNILTKEKPDYIAIAFDKKGKTFRHEEYEQYKATRVKPPQELYDQIPRVRELVEAFEIPIFEIEGYEADDVLGTLADQAYREGDLQTYIVTGDLDTLQLVNDKTFVLTPHKGFSETVKYGYHKVMERYGLEPSQMVDFKGLRGDVSDNIPGVKGIGEKTAVALLKKYKSIEGIYEHINEIEGSVKNKLVAGKDDAFFSKRLVTLIRDVPMKLDLKKCKTHEFNKKKIEDLFEELAFKTLLKRFQEFEKGYEERIKKDCGQQTLF